MKKIKIKKGAHNKPVTIDKEYQAANSRKEPSLDFQTNSQDQK